MSTWTITCYAYARTPTQHKSMHYRPLLRPPTRLDAVAEAGRFSDSCALSKNGTDCNGRFTPDAK
jgi:hypothetical protein